jgi:hypothetical protein
MTQDLVVNIGEDFYAKLFIREGVNRTAKNLTGYTFAGGIKSAFTDIENIVDFTLTSPSLGVILATIPVKQVARLQDFQLSQTTARRAEFVYTISMTLNDAQTRLLDGKIKVNLSV